MRHQMLQCDMHKIANCNAIFFVHIKLYSRPQSQPHPPFQPLATDLMMALVTASSVASSAPPRYVPTPSELSVRGSWLPMPATNSRNAE